MHRPTARTASALAAAAALTLTACGSQDPEPETTQPTGTETVTEEPTATETVAPEPEQTSEPTTQGDDTQEESASAERTQPAEGTEPAAEADLPGTDFTSYFSEAGQVADVVGVESGDVLFVRALPDPTSEEVGRLAPTGDTTLAGRERNVKSGIWAEVELDGGVGWVNTNHLGYIPDRGEDITDELRALDADGTGEAVDAARNVAESYVESEHGAGGPRPNVIMVETPAHDTPIYRVDIIGQADDSVLGERLELIMEAGASGYQVAEGTGFQLCRRGAGAEGLCA